MLAFWLVVLPAVAHADLYRWIDPETGSVKLSSLPPNDPRIQAEIVRYNAPAPKPAALPVFGKPAAVTAQDFDRGGEGLRQHLEAYDAVRAERLKKQFLGR